MSLPEPLYLAGGCFGWHHRAAGASRHDTCAVVCPALAPEYTRSHRSLRHLAETLAGSGIPALRFDYHGTGDSPGDDFDPDRWSTWKGNVRDIARQARELTGRSRVCVIGLRLGATVAAAAAAEEAVELLVLWAPCVTGRGYLRELRAMTLGQGQPADFFESAGAVYSPQTVASLEEVDLAGMDWKSRMLVVTRDDLASNVPFQAETVVGAGYAGMMAEHQFTVVPEAAIAAIVQWISAN
jgi:alpha-beta hydrolase superfamily lysophospholipase